MKRPRSSEPAAVRIDPENEWAWCGERRLVLTPRAFAVLRHLVDHRDRLITKDDLFTTVWRDAIVSNAALGSCVRDLRKALGDSSAAPRYIQTVHRRGFRFIGPIAGPTAAVSVTGPTASAARSDVPPPAGRARASEAFPTLVGREAELARLHARFESAANGQRQLVFVTGEPGIGKTVLVEAFLAGLGSGDGGHVGRGQCVEQYGAGEPYLPVLEALGRLGRTARGERLVHILKQHAPTWLGQLPGLLSDADMEAVQRRAQGAGRDRMLRELVEALEALTTDAPLVLLLEDVHWSDSATIDLLAMLARRREAARLLVLATYRPADVAAAEHPLRWLKQELQLHGHCDEVPVELLSVAAVGEYLLRRFPGHTLPPELASMLHRNTDGNPLFLVNTIDYLIAQGQLREVDGRWGLALPVGDIPSRVPETVWQLIERQAEQLTADEQAMLSAASVAGAEFSAAAVGVAVGIDPEEVERRCEALARRGQFLRAAGIAEWPDGTMAGRYAFIHALHQQVLYSGVSGGARVELHRRTGQGLERAWNARAGDIAGELAMHFEQGKDRERAARYRIQAGEHALRRHAYREAADHAARALDLLRRLPDSPDRTRQEMTAQIMLGAALTATQGYALPEVAQTYARARELCAQVGDTPQVFPVLLGLGRFHVVRAEFAMARDVAMHLRTVAEATRDTALLLAAHNTLGAAALYAGEFEAALASLERASELYDRDAHTPTRCPLFQLGPDPGVSCASHTAWALWMLGYPDRAAASAQEALRLARSLGHPFSVSFACHFAAGLYQWLRDRQAVQEIADEAMAHDTEHGFGLFLLAGVIHRGWLLAELGQGEEGLAQMRQALPAFSPLWVPAAMALVAEMHGRIGRPAEGLSFVAEGLAAVERAGRHYFAAELHRLRGVLTRELDTGQPGDPGDAREARPDTPESCLLEAIEEARRQRARSLELRAATSLSRLWANAGKRQEAHALLSSVYDGFTEGFETPDLREARSLLEELEGRPARDTGPTEAGPRRVERARG